MVAKFEIFLSIRYSFWILQYISTTAPVFHMFTGVVLKQHRIKLSDYIVYVGRSFLDSRRQRLPNLAPFVIGPSVQSTNRRGQDSIHDVQSVMVGRSHSMSECNEDADSVG